MVAKPKKGCLRMASIYRRGKVYWARAQRQGDEHRISLQTANREIAERRFRQWLNELDAIKWGDKPRRLYLDAQAKFIAEHLTTIKPGAAKRYGVSLKSLAEQFGGMALDQITSATLSEFETKRRTDGVSAGTIRRDLACLSSLFTSAIDWEWTETNPVPPFMRRRARRGLKEAPGRTRYLTEGEERALLAKATEAVRSAMVLAIDTGLRREELFSLEWPQVNLVRGLIITTSNTKSGRKRTVPLPARSRTILGTLPRHMDCSFVLINPDTGTRYLQMNKGLKAAARRAKLADVRWHDLRRTAGCRWLQRDGRKMEEVSGLLGHSSVQVTENRYAFLNLEAIAESLAARTKPGTRNSGVK